MYCAVVATVMISVCQAAATLRALQQINNARSRNSNDKQQF